MLIFEEIHPELKLFLDYIFISYHTTLNFCHMNWDKLLTGINDLRVNISLKVKSFVIDFVTCVI